MPTPNQLIPPQSPEGVHTHGPEDFGVEFVTHDGYSPFNHLRTLSPSAVMDVVRDVTPEELARVSRDPKVHKAKRIIINGTLTDDLLFAPGATEEEAGGKARHAKYLDTQAFCERMIAGLERPYWLTLEEMIGGALEQGHAIAEVVWKYRIDKATRPLTTNTKQRGATPRGSFMSRMFAKINPWAAEETPAPAVPNRFARRATARLMPESIKVKPHGAARFVVDDFYNTIGIVPAHSSQNSWVSGEVISRDKFLILAFNCEANDPRGLSTWRPIFNYQNLASHIPKNYLKLILQEGMPIPVFELPEKMDGWLRVKNPITGGDVLDPLTGKPKLVTVAEAANMTLEAMYVGKGVTIPHGGKLEPYRQSGQGVGEVFVQALKVIYNIVEEGILLQPLAQSSGEVGSKSLGALHADVLTDAFFWYKRSIAVMTLYDLCAVGVRMNLGESYLPFMPKLSLGDSEKRDWARDLEVLAKAFWYGFIDETQRAELMSWLSLPKPGPPSTQPKSGQAEADVNGDPAPPSSGRPDKGDVGRKQPSEEGQDTNAEMRERFAEVTNNVKAYESRTNPVGHNARRRKTFVEYLPGRAYAKGRGSDAYR